MVEITERDVSDAAIKWCGEKDRETSMDDIIYFKSNWRALPGLRVYVERLATQRAALALAQKEG